MNRVLRLGTRGSVLAMTQSGHVADRLREAGIECELVRIRTEGDVNGAPLTAIGGTGVFVTAVRTALLAGEVDLIVHSYKDLPTAAADGVRLVAVPPREDPSDALCARDGLTFRELPEGATVGTGSPRRQALLRRLRPDLDVRAIRGNVDTRLNFVTDRKLDAVVLASAGLRRMGRESRITSVFSPDEFLPAPAQGALAVECRDESSWYTDVLSELDDADSRAAALAERTFLAELEAGCSAPVAALGRVRSGELHLEGSVVALDGTSELRDAIDTAGADAADAGRVLARRLLARGAAALMGALR